MSDNQICGIVCHCGVKYAPLACGLKAGHEGEHSWANLPTFGEKDPASELAEVWAYVRSHERKQHVGHGGLSAAEDVRAVLREYEDKATRALSDVKRFRDDMVTFFRALALCLEMVGSAQTHGEKNARLRGAIELLESHLESLRRSDIDFLFSHFRWRDVFSADWPTRRLLDRIHELERELGEAKSARGCRPPPSASAPRR